MRNRCVPPEYRAPPCPQPREVETAQTRDLVVKICALRLGRIAFPAAPALLGLALDVVLAPGIGAERPRAVDLGLDGLAIE